MRNLMASLLLALALGACASTPKTETFVGVYLAGLEVDTFYPQARPLNPYWVAESDARAALRALAPANLTPGQSVRIVATVEGELSRRGQYGPLGAYGRQLHIRTVVSARLEDAAP